MGLNFLQQQPAINATRYLQLLWRSNQEVIACIYFFSAPMHLPFFSSCILFSLCYVRVISSNLWLKSRFAAFSCNSCRLFFCGSKDCCHHNVLRPRFSKGRVGRVSCLDCAQLIYPPTWEGFTAPEIFNFQRDTVQLVLLYPNHALQCRNKC